MNKSCLATIVYFAVLGILIYNGKNLSGEGGSKEYAAGTYCAGQALFDLHDPSRLLKRLDKPFLTPEYDFERTGQYAAGTVFNGAGLPVIPFRSDH